MFTEKIKGGKTKTRDKKKISSASALSVMWSIHKCICVCKLSREKVMGRRKNDWESGRQQQKWAKM
jgi:hypothetical protein